MTQCEKACEILRLTKDGEELSPEHLWLVENAVNGFLNDKGEEKFRSLYEDVAAGRYHKPYLHGIEYLTINHEGFVHWRGKHVEHYDISFAFSDKGREATLELASRCRYLEKKGIEVNMTNVVWRWKKFQ